MPTLHLLGTGAALSDGSRTTTMLAVEHEESALLIDCGGDVIQRVQAHDIELDTIDALFLTHYHPDHVSGFPLLVEKLWLAQRRKPLPIYGPPSALDQARRCFDTFDTSSWTDLFERTWHDVPPEHNHTIRTDDQWIIRSTPGDHGDVPVIGLRIESKTTDTALGYSADTHPSPAVAELCRDVDLLVHEATGESPSHSTPEEAAGIAARAGAGRLVLVHLPPGASNDDLEGVKRQYDGPAAQGKDGDIYTF